MKKYLPSHRVWVIASFLVFSLGIMSGWTWWDKQSPQAQYYMLGRVTYMTTGGTPTRFDLAAQYFQKSYASYLEQSQVTDVYSPPASLEIAELALHYRALSLLKMGNAKLAVTAFKDALKLTTEYELARVNLSADEASKIRADRKITQIDFEILFNQQQEQAKQEGKGKPQPGQQGDKQSQDPSKGNNAGKTDRNAL